MIVKHSANLIWNEIVLILLKMGYLNIPYKILTYVSEALREKKTANFYKKKDETCVVFAKSTNQKSFYSLNNSKKYKRKTKFFDIRQKRTKRLFFLFSPEKKKKRFIILITNVIVIHLRWKTTIKLLYKPRRRYFSKWHRGKHAKKKTICSLITIPNIAKRLVVSKYYI